MKQEFPGCLFGMISGLLVLILPSSLRRASLRPVLRRGVGQEEAIIFGKYIPHQLPFI